LSSGLEFFNTPISGLYVVERKLIQDNRGFFFRIFDDEDLIQIGLNKPIRHINFSHTNKKHTVKGLHFQYPPHAETKIVTCVKGEVYDVAVDLRKGSPTFLAYFGVRLSSENRKSLYIPEGFAHGFQAIQEDSELIYLHSEGFFPKSEGGFSPLDPRIGIQWPHPLQNLSERDKSFEKISTNFYGLEIK
jgi:dTDP-4-dehydrorhamnose 3,5-epimerase